MDLEMFEIVGGYYFLSSPSPPPFKLLWYKDANEFFYANKKLKTISGKKHAKVISPFAQALEEWKMSI